MGDEKRYYWLKLAEDFYEDDTIQWIEEQENGVAYVNFYLKLLLKSLKDDGYLIRFVGTRLIPYDVKSLARLTNTDPDTVRVAMELFKQVGLVELMDSGEIYMSQIDEMIGSETQAAKRMRKLRAKEALETQGLDDKKQLESKRNNVTNERNNVQECYTEYRVRDKEIEIDKENREKSCRAKHDRVDEKIPYKEIVDYLNSKTDKNYRPTTAKTKDLIKARYNEGFRLDEFKKVIDNKVIDWSNNEKMNKYLRPETLFSNKFEGYLNEVPYQQPRKQDYTEDISIDDDIDDLEAELDRIINS